MRKHVFCGLFFLLILWACSPQISEMNVNATATQVAHEIFASQTASVPTASVTPQFTPTFMSTSTVTPTPTPTPIPVVVAKWENLEITSICLEVKQSYPQFEEDIEIPIASGITKILEELHIEVLAPGEDCQADLLVNFEGYSVPGKYYDDGGTGTKNCYSGASIDGYIRFMAEGFEQIDISMSGGSTPQFFSGPCYEEPTTKAPFYQNTMNTIVPRLTEIWGIAVPVTILASDNEALHLEAAESLRKASKEELQTVLPVLITALENAKSVDTKEMLVTAIRRLGSGAMDAVPTLIRGFEVELEKNSLVSRSYIFYEALRNIMGRDSANLFSANSEPWWMFWEIYAEADTTRLLEILSTELFSEVRIAAIQGLAASGDFSDEVVTALLAAMEDEDEGVREAAVLALTRNEESAAQVVKIFKGKLAQDDDSYDSIMLKFAKEMGVDGIPILIEIGSRKMDNVMHYTNTSRSALNLLASITGEEYDTSAWGDKEAWYETVSAFLERCQGYYDSHKDD